MSKLTLQDVAENQTGKVWYKSKSVWLGIVTLTSGALSAAVELLPILQLGVDPLTYSVLLFTLGLLAIVLRLVTEGPILK